MNREQWDRDQTMMRIAKALEELVKLEKFKNPLYEREINKKNKPVE